MGTYRRTGGTGTGTTYGEMPLTSYNALSHFADELPSVRGIELFRATLRRSMPMSFSPMETMLALMLTLPTGLGGYGLPRPILNVRLRAGRAGISSQRTILPDLYWPEREVLLEYESFEFHEGSPGPLGANEKLAHDAERANTLLAMGMRVTDPTTSRSEENSSAEPGTSRVPGCSGDLLGNVLRPMTNEMIPTGTLTRKIELHPVVERSSPPMAGPTIDPTAATVASHPSACPRSLAGNVSVMMP